MRALVERGSFDIAAFADNTGDVVESGGKVFANKPPGQALLGAPFYFVLFHLERAVAPLRISERLEGDSVQIVFGERF